jgi:hypothetical protein
MDSGEGFQIGMQLDVVPFFCLCYLGWVGCSRLHSHGYILRLWVFGFAMKGMKAMKRIKPDS